MLTAASTSTAGSTRCASPRPPAPTTGSATAAGGSMERFYDLEEDPAASLDLAGALMGSASPWGLHNAGISVSGTYYNTGINTNGPRLDLLEATPARGKLRQESFYQR